MTAIAWAIMFIGLIFYDAIYEEKLKISNSYNIVSNITAICFVVLIACTIRELMR